MRPSPRPGAVLSSLDAIAGSTPSSGRRAARCGARPTKVDSDFVLARCRARKDGMTNLDRRLAARAGALRALSCGIALAAGIACLPPSAGAALIAGHEVTPFLMIGYIEKFTLD